MHDYGWLTECGDFLIVKDALDGTPGPTRPPRTLEIDGKRWYRFMDWIYTPAPAFELHQEAVVRLCDLRLAHKDRLISRGVNGEALALLADCVKDVRGADRYVDILDFGCGDGEAGAFLMSKVRQSRVVFADVSEAALQRATALGRDRCTLIRDGVLPFDSDVFDLVIAAYVFHFQAPWHMLGEIKRCLRVGGVFAATIYGPYTRAFVGALDKRGFSPVTTVSLAARPSHYVVSVRYTGELVSGETPTRADSEGGSFTPR